MTDIMADPGDATPLGTAAGGSVAVAAPTGRAQTRWSLLLKRPTFIVGAIIILFWIVCALFGHAIAPYNPLAQQLLAARDILFITPLATILGTILGTALGLAMGYLGGVFDLITGRIVEAVLALPAVIIAFLFIVALKPSTSTLVIVIGLIFTPLIARTVRAAVLT